MPIDSTCEGGAKALTMIGEHCVFQKDHFVFLTEALASSSLLIKVRNVINCVFLPWG